jgi:signal transduction histidine kinase
MISKSSNTAHKRANEAIHLKLMNQVTQKALSGSSLSEILDMLASEIVEMTSASGCYITLRNNQRQNLIPCAAHGPDRDAFMDPTHISDEVIFSQTVLDTGHVVFISDIQEFLLFGKEPAAPIENNAMLALPLIVREQDLGVVLIKYQKPHAHFFEEDNSWWEEIAAQISLVVNSILSVENEKQRRKEAELLHQATFTVTSSLDLQEVLEHILTGLEQAVPFDSAAISLIEGDFLKIVALGGSLRHTRQIGEKIGKNEGLFSLLETSRSPVILEDAQMHPKYEQWSDEGKDPIHGWMGIPLIAYDRSIGFLLLNNRERNVYTTDHARLAQAFANQAAVAIENARLFEQVRNGRERMQALSKRLVEIQEAERRLIAHELHDEIGQELTGLQFILSLGKEGQESEYIRAFTEAQALVTGLMAQVRELSLNLHPTMLDDLGLLPTLKSHFERFHQQTGIQVIFEHRGLERRFPAGVELSVFRVVQETLTNVARYAGVKEVQVSLSVENTSLKLKVEDQGRGFNMDILRDSDRSFGVAGIRERTYLVGGKFEIYSNPGEGTRIVAIFPIVHQLERRRNDRQGTFGG